MNKTDEKTQKPFLILTIAVCIVLFLVVIFVLFRISKRSNLRRYLKMDVEMELGSDLVIDDFLNESVDKSYIDMNYDVFQSVGDYKVRIKIQGEAFYSNLHVVDTTNPYLRVRNLTIRSSDELPIVTDFVERITELSNYTIDPIEIERIEGDQEIFVRVRDISGNVTEQKAILTILSDQEVPVFKGLTPLTVELGEKADITSGVVAYAQNLEEVPFIVNDSQVNYSKVGTYDIFYTAQDSLGNKTTIARAITVTRKDITYQLKDFSTTSVSSSITDSSLLSFYDLLKFYDVDVRLEDIVLDIKKGSALSLKDQKLYGGNPEETYVGDPTNQTGFGVYQRPLFDIASKYKEGIVDFTGSSLEDVLMFVKSGVPVQVWVTENLDEPSLCATWNAGEDLIDWYCNMESVVIVGYNSNTISVSSPSFGAIREYSKEQFEKIYHFFGMRALYFEK